MLYLTNRFYLAVRLLSYRSQMTSKCGKNRKVAHEPIGEWVTDVLIVKKQKLIKAFLFRKKVQSRAVVGFSDHEKSDLRSFVIYVKWSKLIGCRVQQRIVIG